MIDAMTVGATGRSPLKRLACSIQLYVSLSQVGKRHETLQMIRSFFLLSPAAIWDISPSYERAMEYSGNGQRSVK